MTKTIAQLNTGNNVAAAYLRVSTEEQESNSSLNLQREYAIQYAKDNNLILPDEFIFYEVKSASTLDGSIILENSIRDELKRRPVLQNILSLIDSGQIGHLIVYSIDRLSRNFEEYITLKFFSEKRNVKIHFTKPDEVYNSTNRALNRLIEVIKANIAELEANIISSRVKQGNASRVKENLWPGGKIPFGYIPKKLGKNRSTIEKSQYESELIQEIFKLYSMGYGYRKIAKIMNEKHCEINWTKSKIEDIIKNQTYTGYIYWNRRGGRRKKYKLYKSNEYIKSMFIKDACIIDDALWEKVSKLRETKVKFKTKSKLYPTSFFLNNKLYCGLCGNPMKGKNYGKKKKSVYRCPYCIENGKSKVIIDKEKIEEKFMTDIDEYIKLQSFDELYNDYQSQYNDYMLKNKQKLKAFQTKLEEIISTINRLENLIKEFEAKNPQNNSENLQLYNLLLEEKILLNKSKQSIESQINQIQLELIKPCLSKEKFNESIFKILKDIRSLTPLQISIFLDLYINKIYAFIEGDTINLKIEFNFSCL